MRDQDFNGLGVGEFLVLGVGLLGFQGCGLQRFFGELQGFAS